MFFYKESTLGFGCSFWLHQGGIPRCTWGFYCCLAAHQRTGTAGFANPSFPILWTLTLPTLGGIRCGGACRLPRACDPFSQLNSGAIATPQFGIWCSCLCSARYRTRFSRFRWVFGRSFFIIGGMVCSFLRLREVFAKIFRRICANRGWVGCFGC